jgi:two-component system nitrate/nitrite response regulator NarL
MKILLLEDHNLVRAGIRELILMSKKDAEVFEASNAIEAISLLDVNEFNIAFLDIKLGYEEDGIDILRFIKSNKPKIKIIMLSAVSSADVILNCLELGACGFISKEFEDEKIFSRVLDSIFDGGIFIPLKRTECGFEISKYLPSISKISPEDFGIRGRALEVLFYICQGYPNKIIAKKMKIEEGTIRKDYVPKLFRIFKVARRTELLVEISRMGLRLPEPPSK